MLNIDGVMMGNSRTTMRGYDMNRCWKCNLNSNILGKSVETAAVLRRLMEVKDSIFSFIDVESHSKKAGSHLIAQLDKDSNMNVDWVKSMLFSKICAENSRFIELSRCQIKRGE